MSRWKILLPGAVLLALLWLGSEPVLAQCAMCRTAFESPEGRRMARAFRQGILLLLGMPFGAVGTVMLLLYRGMRRQRPDVGGGPSPSGEASRGR